MVLVYLDARVHRSEQQRKRTKKRKPNPRKAKSTAILGSWLSTLYTLLLLLFLLLLLLLFCWFNAVFVVAVAIAVCLLMFYPAWLLPWISKWVYKRTTYEESFQTGRIHWQTKRTSLREAIRKAVELGEIQRNQTIDLVLAMNRKDRGGQALFITS